MRRNILNEQEEFWLGEFGKAYIERNKGAQLLASNTNFFSEIFSKNVKPATILELGANIGMNIRAIKTLLPNVSIDAVEINPTAHQILARTGLCNECYCCSIAEFRSEAMYDLTFTKTVLIHLNDEDLQTAYATLYNASSRHILIAEYYSPRREEISYRGFENKLFKNDFCGEMMRIYPDLRLVDYGYKYRQDPIFPQDDITWFLMEKV